MGLHLEHLLVPIDFRASSDVALERAIALAADYRADVTLLHVVPVPFFGRPVDDSEEENAADELRALVQTRVRELRRIHAWRGVILSEVASGSPAEEIVDAADRLDVDAIVLTPRSRSALARAVSPSITDRVMRTANVPVFCVRATSPVWGEAEAEPVEPASRRLGLAG